MTVKKKGQSPPSDDFIDQLLADVGDAGSSSEDSNPMISIGLQEDDGAAPVGLGVDDFRATKVGDAPFEFDSESHENSDEPLDLGNIPEIKSGYDGPSAGYDIAPDLPIVPEDDRTVAIGSQQGINAESQEYSESEATVAVTGFAARKPVESAPIEEKVVIGTLRPSSMKQGNVMTSMDASLAQSESLRLAQKRILDLESEVDRLRQENDSMMSATESMKSQMEEVIAKLGRVEKANKESEEHHQGELLQIKSKLEFKDSELSKAKLKAEEFEGRIKADFKKVRVKERELENRLELLKAEKAALLKTKDDHLLEMKKKVDSLQSDLASYRYKVSELNQTIEMHQEQFKRTIRALRLALTNLESKDQAAVPLKKVD